MKNISKQVSFRKMINGATTFVFQFMPLDNFFVGILPFSNYGAEELVKNSPRYGYLSLSDLFLKKKVAVL